MSLTADPQRRADRLLATAERQRAEAREHLRTAYQIFLSPRTVEWHLRKIFAKLAITSRRQLREVLPRGDAPTS